MEKDFIPIAQTGHDEMVIVSSTKATNWKTIDDLIAAAKKTPGKMKFATSAPTSSTRIVFEAFSKMVGMKLVMVPFKGSAPACIAVAGGHLPLICAAVSEALPHVKRGDMLPLLMMGDKRAKEFPDCPTAQEKGWDFNMSTWHVLFAPKGISPQIVAKIESIAKKLVDDKDYQAAMDAIGSKAVFKTGKDFAKYWKSEREKMGALIMEIGIVLAPESPDVFRRLSG